MSDYRSYGVVLKQAELIASSSETVAAWLEDTEAKWFDSSVRDDELEQTLLSRSEPLIDLALARHGVCQEVLSNLFARNDETLRAAILANEKVIRRSIMFSWDFATEEPNNLSWLAGLTNIELEALFSNPALPDSFISDLFAQKGAWPVLSEDQRLFAVSSMTESLSARKERWDFGDGWDHYTYSKVFDAAWTFSALAEVNVKWAARLGRLYSGLEPHTFSDFDPLEVAARWQATKDEIDWGKKQAEQNLHGYLGSFQEVRRGLARLAAGKEWKHSETRETILNNQDVAIRCGGYLVFRFTPDEIKQAWQTDKRLAARHLIYNDKAWANPDSREALEEICRWASKGQDYLVSINRERGNREDILRESHPDWFEDENFVEDALEKESREEVRFETNLWPLTEKLNSLQRDITVIRIIAIAVIVALVLERWLS